MKFPFRRDFRVPFPAIPVALRNQDLGFQMSDINALLDTGADATMVPLSFLRELAASEIIESTVASHWGDVRTVRLYLIDLEISGMLLPSVVVVGDDFGDDVILGRDVLNKLRLLLDGPNKETQIR